MLIGSRDVRVDGIFSEDTRFINECQVTRKRVLQLTFCK